MKLWFIPVCGRTVAVASVGDDSLVCPAACDDPSGAAAPTELRLPLQPRKLGSLAAAVASISYLVPQQGVHACISVAAAADFVSEDPRRDGLAPAR